MTENNDKNNLKLIAVFRLLALFNLFTFSFTCSDAYHAILHLPVSSKIRELEKSLQTCCIEANLSSKSRNKSADFETI